MINSYGLDEITSILDSPIYIENTTKVDNTNETIPDTNNTKPENPDNTDINTNTSQTTNIAISETNNNIKYGETKCANNSGKNIVDEKIKKESLIKSNETGNSIALLLLGLFVPAFRIRKQ